MEWMLQIVDIFLHLDHHLGEVILQYGHLAYLILFLIIFCETGLVVTPFLPGDSLLFAAGALSVTTSLELKYLFPLLTAAAILGDMVNFHIGDWLGPKVFQKTDSRIFKKKYLDQTHAFYEKYGGKTIIFARFIPIVRTFAPFVAGVGKMNYSKFLAFNVIGAVAWMFLFLFAGYWFGNIPLVKENFTLVIMVIIVLSVLPPFYEYWKTGREAKKLKTASH